MSVFRRQQDPCTGDFARPVMQLSKSISSPLTLILLFGAPVLATAAAHPAPAASAADNNQVFSFQDYLNHDWTNELVRVSLPPAQAQKLAAKPALLGPDGQPVAYQMADAAAGQAPVIQFLANIKAGTKATYQFSATPNSGAKMPATDLKLEEDDNTLRVTNHLIGISLRKKLGTGEGPVEKIRLTSGKWTGGSTIGDKLPPTNYSAKVVCSGPVFDEVECRTEFGNGLSWVLNFRVEASEPVIVVRESMDLGDAASSFSLGLGGNTFDPDHIFYRAGMDKNPVNIGTNLSSEIKPGSVFTMEPWLFWAARLERGPVFSLYREDGPDMLSVGAGFASLWVDPKIAPEKRAAPQIELKKDESGLHLDFALKNGKRQWMIMTPDKAASLKSLDDPKNLVAPSLPHEYVIKHGQFPLNMVKDYVLDWPNTADKHPSLLMTKARVAQYKAAHAKDAPLTDAQIRYAMSQPLNQFSMQVPLEAYYATNNPQITKFLVDQCVQASQEMVDTFLEQPTVPYGSAPHHLQILGSTPLALDAILDDPSVSPELRKKLLAQVAFASYAMNRDDFWSPDRGYAANPNMTTSVLGYEVEMGSLIPSHPMAKQWVGKSMDGLKTLLYGWSDDNGGWLEAPHYAMTSYDVLLGCGIMAKNAGLSDMVFDPRMKLVINWFAKWSTPKDSRLGGYRHLPPVGNTYMYEPTGAFGWVAAAWKDKDPEFASQMEWMFRQQRSFEMPGVGGGAPTMAGHRHLFLDDSIPEKAPHYGSEMFPRTGVVLRNGYPSDRETYMLLLQGNFDGWRSHYDDDSGSVTIWGKGRIIADDFGYYNPSSADHNLPMAPEIAAGRTFQAKVFAPSKEFDYVSGNRGAWQRQVALVKSDDPLAPNFFVVADTFKTAKPANWTMCFTADKVTPGANAVQIVGKEDVDTDIFFAKAPDTPFRTEVKTRTANSGMLPDGRQSAITTTQIGLLAGAPTDGAMTYVIYPRLKTEKTPVCTAIADGKGFKIETDTETDYVFLSSNPVTWKDDAVNFSGKSGAVRIRKDDVVLSLGEGGSIGAGTEVLTADGAARKVIKR